jgi:hypothetical protein
MVLCVYRGVELLILLFFNGIHYAFPVILCCRKINALRRANNIMLSALWQDRKKGKEESSDSL